jgi:hypothetical protein
MPKPAQAQQNKERIDMIKQTKPLAFGLRIDSGRSNRRQSAGTGCTSAKALPMRISRGNQVIGNWSALQIKERLGSEDLLLTDLFYDEDLSDWLPLSQFQIKQAPVNAEKTMVRLCYCGTGLPFQVCCGDGSTY